MSKGLALPRVVAVIYLDPCSEASEDVGRDAGDEKLAVDHDFQVKLVRHGGQSSTEERE